jgi:hypothetical protein
MKEELKFTNIGNKESQKELIKEIMDLDANDGLYEISDEEIEKEAFDYVENSEEDKWTATLTFIAGAKWAIEKLKNR